MRIRNTLAYMVLICITSILQAQDHTTKLSTIYASEVEYARLQHIKSALDGQGNIHIVFTGFENRLYYGNNVNGSWTFEQIKYPDADYGDSTAVAFYPNIAIDGSNRIHITIFGQYKEKIYYADRGLSGDAFDFKMIKPSPLPLRFYVYGEYTDMAIDLNGGLHLICRADYTDQQEYKYNEAAVYLHKPADSEKWQLQVLAYDNEMYDQDNWFFGNNSSIACHGNKVYAAIGGSNKLHFGTKDIAGGSWEIEELLYTSDEFINSGKDNLSLAVSPDGNIKFAFFDRTDDEKSPIHGLAIYSRNTSCGDKDWKAYNGWDKPLSMNAPAMAFNSKGKAYLFCGQITYALYEQNCDCKTAYNKIYGDDANSCDFADMLIDAKDVVHVFFGSNDENKLYHLSVSPGQEADECNYPPMITGYTGKTNVGPGETWTGTISATDNECDNIDFYSIILPDYVTIDDHGDGTASIHAIIPEGEGFGDVGFTVFARDPDHQDIDNKVSAITFMLKLTQEGKEEGYVKVENKCYE